MHELLAQTLDAEDHPDRDGYVRAVRALALALLAPKTRSDVQTALLEWLIPTLSEDEAVLSSASLRGMSDWDEALHDAGVDMIADATAFATFLERTAACFEQRPEITPNLRSMLQAKAQWRAKDRLRSRTLRQRRERTAQASPVEASGETQSQLIARLCVEKVIQSLGQEPQFADAFEGLLRGDSITEVADRTGLSRQQIYRLLARARDFIAEDQSKTRRADV